MASITLNGNQYSADGSATRDMLNGGHRTWLLPMLQDGVADVAAKATLTSGNLVAVQALAATATGSATTLGSAQCGVMIPLYKYPNNPFNDPDMLDLLDIIRAYRSVPTIAIVNPASGPGTVEDGNYTALIKALKGAGARVLGYVQTNYGGSQTPFHTEAQVKADISSWLTVYPNSLVQGIFLDEMNYYPGSGVGGTGTDYIELYTRYTSYCHGLNLYPVVGNPGTNQREEWFANPTADIIVVHETSTLPVDDAMHGNSVGGHVQYPPRQRAVMAYAQTSLDEHKLRKTRRYVNWLYYNGDALPNPWDTLPSFMRQLYSALSDTGSLGTGPQFLAWPTVRVASTANINIASPGSTIDGVTMVLNDRVLLKNQTTTSQNGIYVWNTAATPLVRATDMDTSWSEVTPYFLQVTAGTVNAGTIWDNTSAGSGTIGSTAITWASAANATMPWDCGEVEAGTFTIIRATTMAAPKYLLPGRKYRLLVTQDATGSRNLSFNAAYKFPSGTTLPITGTAGKKHVIEFLSDGTNLYALSVNIY